MNEIIDSIVLFVNNSGILGILLANALIFVESIFPVLPVIVFITANFMLLGNILGFLSSWIFIILGCIMSYEIFKRGFGDKFEHLTENKELLKKYKKMFKNISTGKLVLIVAFPFTPAFMVNIAAGLVKMDFKKYLTALIIGKISLVIYSAYVGLSFIESFKDPIIILKILAIILGVYILYRIVNKVFKLE